MERCTGVPPARSAQSWEVLRIGYTDSDARVSTSSGAWQGLWLSIISIRGILSYWEEEMCYLCSMPSKPYAGKSLRKYVTADSWELGWDELDRQVRREEFQKQRGYDPVPYLPVVAGRIVGSRGSQVQTSWPICVRTARPAGKMAARPGMAVLARGVSGWGRSPSQGGHMERPSTR